MADYHPLIARAVNGLDKNTGEIRRALYERARSALVNQLRSVEPALEESDITRERLALEEAIRKVEAEAVKRARLDAPELPPSISDQGLRGFRDTVADAEGLGDAAAEANRAAHKFYESMPGDHPPPSGDNRLPPAEHYFEPPPAPEPQHLHEAPIADEQAPPPEVARAAPPSRYEQDDEVSVRPLRSYGRVIRFILLLLVLAGLAGGAYWQRHAIMAMVASYRSAPAPKPRETAAPTSRLKIPDRVGAADGTPAAANAPAAAVAQKVVLYDEDPSDPKGKRYVGSALRRTEAGSPGPGLGAQVVDRGGVR